MTKIFNKIKSKENRRHLRKNMTEPEHLLWYRLGRKQFYGYKFRRQHGIGDYIVDFYCPKLKLVIEIDGDSHFNLSGYTKKDKERQKYIESLGISVLRFTNLDVCKNMDGVLETILKKLSSSS